MWTCIAVSVAKGWGLCHRIMCGGYNVIDTGERRFRCWLDCSYVDGCDGYRTCACYCGRTLSLTMPTGLASITVTLASGFSPRPLCFPHSLTERVCIHVETLILIS